MSLLEFHSKLYADGQCEETELDIDKNETGNDKGDQSVGVEETKNSRVHEKKKSCRLPLTATKKEKQETATESEPKTSKHATKRQKKWRGRSSTKYQTKKNAHLRHGEE